MTIAIVGACCLCAAFSVYLEKRLRTAHMDWPELLKRMDRINPRPVTRNDMRQPQFVRRVKIVIECPDEAWAAPDQVAQGRRKSGSVEPTGK